MMRVVIVVSVTVTVEVSGVMVVVVASAAVLSVLLSIVRKIISLYVFLVIKYFVVGCWNYILQEQQLYQDTHSYTEHILSYDMQYNTNH